MASQICVGTLPLSTLLILLIASSSSSAAASSPTNDQTSFLRCFSSKLPPSTDLSQVLYSRNSSSYNTILQFSAQNPYLLSELPIRPLYIITPRTESQIQAAVICSMQNGLQIRVRSGGHDYEGLSYVARDREPFLLLDLINYRAIDVDVEEGTAWVQAGATMGELYYTIGQKSRNTLGFAAGVCPTMGVGGHFGGGGIGLSMRKHGLAIDNIVDAVILDVNGDVLDRKAMGEDLFWAIRGGGAASFGVVLSWKLKLVRVPPSVAVFTVTRTVEEGATKLMSVWQRLAAHDQLPDELAIRVILQATGSRTNKNSTIQASFNSLYYGSVLELLAVMNQSFPELGLKAEDCKEMSWVESTMYFAGFPSGTPKEALLNRSQTATNSFKNKSDFVKKPISEQGLRGIWRKLLEEERGQMILEPLGGKINTVSVSETPFAHRKGNLYNIQYVVTWLDGADADKYIDWMRSLYRFMTPFVSQSPRGAFLNYRDLDLGMNEGPNTSYKTASVWGLKYFLGNFRRLALVKGIVDKDNYFRSEQSIPPLLA